MSKGTDWSAIAARAAQRCAPRNRRRYMRHLEDAKRALAAAQSMANAYGYRTDCLNCAVRDVDGAIRNVIEEDEEHPHGQQD